MDYKKEKNSETHEHDPNDNSLNKSKERRKKEETQPLVGAYCNVDTPVTSQSFSSQLIQDTRMHLEEGQMARESQLHADGMVLIEDYPWPEVDDTADLYALQKTSDHHINEYDCSIINEHVLPDQPTSSELKKQYTGGMRTKASLKQMYCEEKDSEELLSYLEFRRKLTSPSISSECGSESWDIYKAEIRRFLGGLQTGAFTYEEPSTSTGPGSIFRDYVGNAMNRDWNPDTADPSTSPNTPGSHHVLRKQFEQYMEQWSAEVECRRNARDDSDSSSDEEPVSSKRPRQDHDYVKGPGDGPDEPSTPKGKGRGKRSTR